MIVRFSLGAAMLLAPAAAQASVVFSAAAVGTRVVTIGRTPLIETSYGLNETRTDDFTGDPNNIGRATLSNVTIADSNGDFFFKHDVLTFGAAEVNISSVLTVTATNTDLVNAAPAQRFDSLIIPGHLGVVQNAGTTSFNAAVANFEVNLDGQRVYFAGAQVLGGGSNSVRLLGSFASFNGLTQFNDGPFVTALDWSATNVNINLGTFAPGQTKVLTYETITLISGELGQDVCPSLAACGSAQVSFGDPRNNGGTIGINSVANLAAMGNPGSPVVGFAIGTYQNYLRIVDARTPLPDQPALLPIPNYSPVPAPAALGLLGLGVAALAARRRRTAA